MCPLFTCQVSQQDVYYCSKYLVVTLEVLLKKIKIGDILMIILRAVWPQHEVWHFSSVLLRCWIKNLKFCPCRKHMAYNFEMCLGKRLFPT